MFVCIGGMLSGELMLVVSMWLSVLSVVMVLVLDSGFVVLSSVVSVLVVDSIGVCGVVGFGFDIDGIGDCWN